MASKKRAARRTGTVKWFNEKRGLGCITTSDGDEFTVGYDQIGLPGYAVLETGQFVNFEIPRQTPRWPTMSYLSEWIRPRPSPITSRTVQRRDAQL